MSKLFNLLHSFARALSPTRSIIKRSLLSLDLSFRTVGEQQRLWRLSDRLTLLSKGEKKSNFKIYLSARHLFVVYSQFDLLKSFHVAVFFSASLGLLLRRRQMSPQYNKQAKQQTTAACDEWFVRKNKRKIAKKRDFDLNIPANWLKLSEWVMGERRTSKD